MFSELNREKLQAWADISKSCGWWNPFEGVVIACERPSVQQVDDQGRLHRLDGPALLCRDGFPVYAVHGVRMPDWVIEQKELISIEKIDAEQNAEVRRVMIEIFGQERFLIEGGAEEIASDDFGTLYRREIDGDEPLVMVKVVNSTAEPDGTFKDYFLRVPPTCQTPQEAVAWTFDIPSEQYSPQFQS